MHQTYTALIGWFSSGEQKRSLDKVLEAAKCTVSRFTGDNNGGLKDAINQIRQQDVQNEKRPHPRGIRVRPDGAGLLYEGISRDFVFEFQAFAFHFLKSEGIRIASALFKPDID